MTKRIEFNKLTPTGQKRRIKTLLAELGVRKDTVSKRLAIAKIKGKAGQPESCPVARYLKKVTGTGIFKVNSFQVRWHRSGLMSLFLADIHYFETPRGVHDFVKAFDIGSYPNLRSAY